MNQGRPVPVISCSYCGGTIWRQGHWFQCPDCGALSAQFGGQFPNRGIDGRLCGPVADFKAAVDTEKIRRAEEQDGKA